MNALSPIPKNIAESPSVSDERQFITTILEGNEVYLACFLQKNCSGIFRFILKTRLQHLNIEADELINDFYIYLQKNNWEKLRSFRYESKLQTWINVVASRYLLKKYGNELKENSVKRTPIEGIRSFSDDDTTNRMVRAELLEAIGRLKEKRHQQVLLLGLQGFDPKEIGEQLGTSVNNVYVIKSRAVEQLKNLINE